MRMGRQQLAVLAASFLAVACASSGSEGNPPTTVKLGVGGGAAIAGTSWTVIFDSVISDSRCPVGVFCIQAGEALLALELASPLASPLPQDSPHFTLGATPVTVAGIRFTTVAVAPLRRVGETIDPRSYKLTLAIAVIGRR